MRNITIQEEIKVSEKFIEETIKHYESMSDKYFISFGDFNGNRDDIIREIKKLSDVGKHILVLNYDFKKWK